MNTLSNLHHSLDHLEIAMRKVLIFSLVLMHGLCSSYEAFGDSVKIGKELYENVKIFESGTLYYFRSPNGDRAINFTKKDVDDGKVEIIKGDSVRAIEPAPQLIELTPSEPTEQASSPPASVNPSPSPVLVGNGAPSNVSTLTVRMALVRSDLSIVPVPRRSLIVSSQDNPGFAPLKLTTTLDGHATSTLPSGSYRIRSESPVEFEGKTYNWDTSFAVGSGETVIELSNDNAVSASILPNAPVVATPLLRPVAPAATGAGTVYESAIKSVATLDVESGHGTAFLIDSSGLLLTNEHVVSGSRSFIVNFSKSERYRSVLIASDPIADIAVIRIHPEAVAGRTPLRLANDSVDLPALKEGDPIYAIGSPISQEGLVTAGIVGKIEERAIISDVMIDHGNSGGPMLNDRGEVVGINTFGQGRGVSGTIRIANAKTLVAEARTKAPMFWVPSATKLPAYPSEKYPPDALKRIVLEQEFDLTKYLIRARKFDVLILTPPAGIYYALQVDIETAQAREKKRKRKGVDGGVQYDPASVIKGWGEYAGLYAPTVKVLIQPKIKATAGSVFGAMLLGSAVLNYKYAGEFDDMQLLRGGVEQPVIKIGREMMKAQIASNAGRMEDAAYAGSAEYLPDAFLSTGGPVQPVIILISDELNPDKKIEVEVPFSVLERIRQDFAPMNDAK